MRRRITVGVATVAAMLGAGVVGAPTAHADELTCRGTLGARTVDNLRVPQGATCTLKGTKIKGTLKVERNATLQAVRIRVVGNVQGEGAAIVRVLQGSNVGGSVQVVQGGLSRVADSVVKGDILNDENRRAVSAVRSRVGGNIQAFKNTGGVTFSTNRVNGNLQCKENKPRPTGSGNIVQGNKEDQCSRL